MQERRRAPTGRSPASVLFPCVLGWLAPELALASGPATGEAVEVEVPPRPDAGSGAIDGITVRAPSSLDWEAAAQTRLMGRRYRRLGASFADGSSEDTVRRPAFVDFTAKGPTTWTMQVILDDGRAWEREVQVRSADAARELVSSLESLLSAIEDERVEADRHDASIPEAAISDLGPESGTTRADAEKTSTGSEGEGGQSEAEGVAASGRAAENGGTADGEADEGATMKVDSETAESGAASAASRADPSRGGRRWGPATGTAFGLRGGIRLGLAEPIDPFRSAGPGVEVIHRLSSGASFGGVVDYGLDQLGGVTLHRLRMAARLGYTFEFRVAEGVNAFELALGADLAVEPWWVSSGGRVFQTATEAGGVFRAPAVGTGLSVAPGWRRHLGNRTALSVALPLELQVSGVPPGFEAFTVRADSAAQSRMGAAGWELWVGLRLGGVVFAKRRGAQKRSDPEPEGPGSLTGVVP